MRLLRFVALLFAYSLVLSISLAVSLLLRFDINVPSEWWPRFLITAIWLLALKVFFLVVFGQFRCLLTYFGMPDALRLACSMGISGLIALVVWFYFQGANTLPRGVLVTDGVLSFLMLVQLRIGMCFYRRVKYKTPSRLRKRTAIVGAGDSGAMICRDIQTRTGLDLDIVCFIDDDSAKIGSIVHGKPVVGPLSSLPIIAKRTLLKRIVIAMPSARPQVIRELVRQINELGLEHEILPSVTQLLNRKVTVTHLRRVSPEDLLGRKPVPLNQTGISAMVKNQILLVTGAGGSIGSELCRQLAEREPQHLILVERSEPALFAVEQELLRTFPTLRLTSLAYDVCDEPLIRELLLRHRPSHVFHAAAHKHVPLMEAQPAEAVSNNTLGTEVLCRLSLETGIRKFTLISTDKAVNPTSVMGASKRLAELVLEAYQNQNPGHCCFSAVRFGNVLGSSGSVIPTFQRQIAEGGPLTVTHPEVTRFFMSIPEAVGLVLQCAWQSSGGEKFVLDMGEPIRIIDLARQVIELSGFEPGKDIEISYTGLRPGEKLYEEPIHILEGMEPTQHPKVCCLRPRMRPPPNSILTALQEKRSHLPKMAPEEVVAWMQSLIPEYRPKIAASSAA